DDNTDGNSPLDATYSGVTTLDSGDIQAIQALYGKRGPDAYEGSNGNDTMSTATQLNFSSGGSFDGSTPFVLFGDVGSDKDVDFYKFTSPLSNYNGPVTIRIQSAGISLLAPSLTVFDASGHVVGQAQANSGLGDTVSVHLAGVAPSTNYYIKVAGATSAGFGIGGYGLAVTFDGKLTTSQQTLDSVLRGDYRTLSPGDLLALFTNPSGVLFNNNSNSGGPSGGVTTLASPPGFPQGAYYQTVG